MRQGQNYHAWELQEEAPVKLDSEEIMRLCMKYGMLAPSIHNTQPWKFRAENKTLTVSPDYEKQLPYADPTGRNLYISLGACVENIVTAASAFGVGVKTTLVSRDKALFCRLEFSERASSYTQNPEATLSLMKNRFSDKKPYLPKEIPASLCEELRLLKVDKAEVTVSNSRDLIEQVAELHSKATISYRSHRQFKKELTQHIKFPRTKAFTGMPGSSMGLDAFKVALGKLILPNMPKAIEKVAQIDKQKILSSGGICLVHTQSDTPRDWIQAGRLYEKISLQLQAEGVHSTTLAAMIETESIRTKVANAFSIERVPQMFLRLGYSDAPVIHTPRSPVETHVDD